ncbi:hypothetical protein [Wenyingzhuangia sp. IMCC45574]
MEFFIRVIYFSNNIHDDCFEKTWKLLSSRSERQVGAFLITYIQEFKEKPPLLSNKMTELRNNAIHKGHIPTKEECIKYGEAILNFIRPIVFLLKKNQKYAWQVVGSANNYGLNNFENKKYSTFANQIFPINRIVSERDSLSITELMEEQQKLIKAYSMAKDKK